MPLVADEDVSNHHGCGMVDEWMAISDRSDRGISTEVLEYECLDTVDAIAEIEG